MELAGGIPRRSDTLPRTIRAAIAESCHHALAILTGPGDLQMDQPPLAFAVLCIAIVASGLCQARPCISLQV